MAKILVVDDERVLVKGITFNLKNEGYQVETGYDGEEAVELAREGKFDLIILDLMMPKIDGSRPAYAPGIFQRAHYHAHARSEDTDKIIGFECGADDYITKPFNILELRPGCGPCCAAPAPPWSSAPPECSPWATSAWTPTSARPGRTASRWSSPPRSLTLWSCSCATRPGVQPGKPAQRGVGL